MRNFLHKFLPSHETVKSQRWLKPFGNWLQHPNLWHLNRRSVAGGVGVGLFCGLIPGPLQMIGATLLAVSFRVNLPVALITTPVSYTHLRAHETRHDLVCRLLLEKK